jgi:thiol-disulfide isomerase/thioredoxin
MKKKFLFALVLISFFAKEISSAQVRAIKFSELEKIMQQKNDSLVVINFWATWCKPCIDELPYFIQLKKNYSSEKLKLIFVSLDFKRDLKKKVVPFVKRKKLNAEVVLLDETNYNSWIDKVDSTWSGAIPATLIIDENHRKYFYEKDFTSYFELEKIIKPLIQK